MGGGVVVGASGGVHPMSLGDDEPSCVSGLIAVVILKGLKTFHHMYRFEGRCGEYIYIFVILVLMI